MTGELAGKSILLVEDEVFICMYLQTVLEEEGACVRAARDVAGGLAATEEAFDAALLDIRLPDGDVYPVADRLVAAGVPVVFHSGHGRAADLAPRYPEARVLTKPCAEEDLIAALVAAGGEPPLPR